MRSFLFSNVKALLVFFTCGQLYAIPLKTPTYRYLDWKNTRHLPGMEPFIGHLSFRNMCDHILDQSTEWFDPDLVKQGDLIYLNIWYLDWFTETVHDQIKVPYILVSGDVGAWIPMREHRKFLYDPKLAAWFCRNMVFSYHPKLFQLPMGQDLHLFRHTAEIAKELLDAWENKANIPKTHLLYMNFFPRGHGDRDKIIQLFENKPFCFYEKNNNLSREVYYHQLASSKFTLSPLGLETDCVRTWEAFAMDSIPIVEHTFNDPIYEGMPILIVDDWTKIDPPFLESKYEELKNLTKEKTYFSYWRELIKTTQERVRNNDLSNTKLEATLFSPEELQTIQVILGRARADFPSLGSSLLYKGFLSTLRPLQLSQSGEFEMKLYDPWMDPIILNDLARKMDFLGKIFLMGSEDEFSNEASSLTPLSVFLDLTYYRTSLRLNFDASVCHKGHFRHSLKSDLETLFEDLPVGSLIIGNMENNPYVKKVLHSFEKEREIKIEKTGSFWSIFKQTNTASLEDLFPDRYPANGGLLSPFQITKWDSCVPILIRLLQKYQMKNVILTGASSNDASLRLGEWIPTDGKVIVLDAFENEEDFQQFVSNIFHTKMTNQIIPLKKDPVEAAATFLQLNSSIDLIYLGSLEDKIRMAQLLKAWAIYVKRGSRICGKGWKHPEIKKQIIQIAKENCQIVHSEEDFWILNP